LLLLDMLKYTAPGSVRVTDAAHFLNVSASTVSRLFATLVAHGYATQASDRRFTLGPEAVALASNKWIEPLLQRSMPILDRVSRATGETASLAQLVGKHVVVLARWFEGANLLSADRPCTILPLWATAAGKALLAQLAPTDRLAALPAEPYPAFTKKTLTSWRALRASLERSRESGVFHAMGEYEPNTESVAVSLPDTRERLAIVIDVAASAQKDRELLRRELIVARTTLGH
jgi:IclR family acetate operon transcriptional repressor